MLIESNTRNEEESEGGYLFFFFSFYSSVVRIFSYGMASPRALYPRAMHHFSRLPLQKMSVSIALPVMNFDQETAASTFVFCCSDLVMSSVWKALMSIVVFLVSL